VNAAAASCRRLPEPFDAIVQRMLAERPAALGDAPLEDVIPLRHIDRPYSRTLYVEVRFAERAWRAYVKICKPSPILDPDAPSPAARGQREFNLLRSLQDAFRDDPQTRAVTPVAFYPEFPVLITEEAPGRELLSELKSQLGWYPSQRALAAMRHVCRLCGRWLAKFQRTTSIPPGQFISLDEVRQYNQRRLDKLVHHRFLGFDDPFRQRVLRALDALADRVQPSDLRPTAIHGDFALGNVLCHEGRIVVLDFPMCGVGAAWLDVTHFHHQLRLLALHPRFRRRTVEQLSQAFLDGYDPRLDRNAPPFRIFELQHTLCQLSRLISFRSDSFAGRIYDRYVARRQLRWLDAACRTAAACRTDAEVAR
jgi:hypothetical protein